MLLKGHGTDRSSRKYTKPLAGLRTADCSPLDGTHITHPLQLGGLPERLTLDWTPHAWHPCLPAPRQPPMPRHSAEQQGRGFGAAAVATIAILAVAMAAMA